MSGVLAGGGASCRKKCAGGTAVIGGLKAMWVDVVGRDDAQRAGCTVGIGSVETGI